MSKLTAERVSSVLRDCLYNPREVDSDTVPADAVIVGGVLLHVGFHPGRLEGHRADVVEMLRELPDAFMKQIGGGMSFLAACETREGEQWGEQRNVDELVCLGLALKLVSFPMPRGTWAVLPGGVPYFAVTLPEVAPPPPV